MDTRLDSATRVINVCNLLDLLSPEELKHVETHLKILLTTETLDYIEIDDVAKYGKAFEQRQTCLGDSDFSGEIRHPRSR